MVATRTRKYKRARRNRPQGFPSQYSRHLLRIIFKRNWQYRSSHIQQRRNPPRLSRRNRILQVSNSRTYFRHHFICPSHSPIESIPPRELHPELLTVFINTPESEETESARIYSAIQTEYPPITLAPQA